MNEKKARTPTGQNLDTLLFMAKHGKITSMDAFTEFNCTRLAARIHDLKEMGYSISGEMKSKTENGKTTTWKEYRLENVC